MGTTLEKVILAVITMHPEKIGGTGPFFYVSDEEELQQISFTLEKILDGVAHEVDKGILIIVRHS
ncbi:hypothetical protein L1765_05935 [Microaerobacter geothermalis]|nr:hypothetical protein [Microaerobacter geothermalis]MCF6093526.1 hypothetical protein [Microaerobacter geothermalis]